MLTQTDLSAIKKIVDTSVARKLKPVKKDLKTVINFFDNEIVTLYKRTDRIEDFLKLPPLSV